MDADLSLIAPALRGMAAEAIAAGDVTGFLCRADNMRGLDLVTDNLRVLKSRGIYEEALLHAFSMPRTNNASFPLDYLRALFLHLADRDRLRAAGDPLPGPGPFTLYRGVSGRGAARRIRGLSWTADLDGK